MRRMIICSALWLVLACSDDDSPLLSVAVVTDLQPGVEFGAVRAVLAEGETLDYVYRSGDDFIDGVRIGTTRVSPGSVTFEVTLLDAGEVVLSRDVVAEVNGDRSVTVLMTRSCVGVTCPMAGDLAATSCLGGVCVRPECLDGECSDTTCAAGDDCASALACGEPRCVAGACLVVPRDTRCAAGQRCDPSAGCVGDAGLDAALDATVDAGTDVPSDVAIDEGAPDTGPVACPERWPESPAGCDPRDSSGCSASRTCQPGPTNTCIITGSAGVGEICGGRVACQRGLICAGAPNSMARCFDPCASGAGCTCPDPTYSCQSLMGTNYGACRRPCDPIDDVGCPDGEACFFLLGTPTCEFPVDTVPIGGDCSYGTDCVPGAYCIEFDRRRQCVRTCRLDESTCTCVSDGTSSVYGFCQPD